MVSRKRVEGQGTTLSNLMLRTPLLGILSQLHVYYSAAPFLTFFYSYLLRTATDTCLPGPPLPPTRTTYLESTFRESIALSTLLTRGSVCEFLTKKSCFFFCH